MRYRAFFSYARADDRIANWLHRQLDSYRTPKALVGSKGDLGPVPAKLHPIFRDRTDLEAGGHVDNALQAALEDSETLLVLCTPTSAKSHWVNHEVETFLKLGREERIFPVIAAGEPDSSDPETECFPPALRGKGLLAADLREIRRPNGHLIGDGKDAGRLKLIAGLLGVSLDQLVRRERRRQRRTIALLASAAAAFALLAATAGVLGWFAQAKQIEAEIRKIEAEESAANERAAKDQAMASEAKTQRTLYETLAAKARMLAPREPGQRPNFNAIRYALAGLELAPDNPEPFRSVLAMLLYEPQEPLKIAPGVRVLDARFTLDGELLIVTERPGGGSLIWRRSADGALQQAGTLDCGGDAAVISPDAGSVVLQGQETCLVEAPFLAPSAKFKPTGAIKAVAPRGEWIVANGSEAKLDIWRRERDGFARAQSLPGADYNHVVAISRDGQKLAIVSGSTGVVYSLTNKGAEIIGELPDNRDLLMTVSFSEDGSRLATGSAIDFGDTLVRIYDVTTKPELISSHDVEYNVMRLSFSRDESRLLAVTMRDIYVIASADTVDSSFIGRFGVELYPSDGWLSPDGRQAVSMRRSSNEVMLWDLGALGHNVGELSKAACEVLGHGRNLDRKWIDQDPILKTEWSTYHDLCEGIAPPLVDDF
jgi:hypothetical protein